MGPDPAGPAEQSALRRHLVTSPKGKAMAVNEQQVAQGDEQLLSRFGYKQELQRTLKFFSIFAISFSVISVTTGIFTNFAFATSEFGPASIWL